MSRNRTPLLTSRENKDVRKTLLCAERASLRKTRTRWLVLIKAWSEIRGAHQRYFFPSHFDDLISSVLVMLIIHKHSISLLVLLLITPLIVTSTSHYAPRKRVVFNRLDAPINESLLTTNAARMRVGLGPLRPRNLVIPSRAEGEYLCHV